MFRLLRGSKLNWEIPKLENLGELSADERRSIGQPHSQQSSCFRSESRSIDVDYDSLRKLKARMNTTWDRGEQKQIVVWIKYELILNKFLSSALPTRAFCVKITLNSWVSAIVLFFSFADRCTGNNDDDEVMKNYFSRCVFFSAHSRALSRLFDVWFLVRLAMGRVERRRRRK